jgi:hypothetical protein
MPSRKVAYSKSEVFQISVDSTKVWKLSHNGDDLMKVSITCIGGLDLIIFSLTTHSNTT